MFRSASGKAIRARRVTAEGAALLVALAASAVVALWHASPARAQGVANPPIAVTSANDDGEGSLRAAINAANGAAGEDTIVFELGPSATITLASQLPTVTDGAGLTIDGGGADITVSGNFRVRVFVAGSGATLTLTKLTVANGLAAAAELGGGIFNGGTVTVSNSTLSGNRAGLGGGINNEGTLEVGSSTFSGNSAGIAGGGIYNRAGKKTTLESTIIANSPGGDCYADSGAITDGGLNLSEDATCGFTASNISISGVDPLLGPLQDNGGPTQTHALQQGSPAIDAGLPPSECPSPTGAQTPARRTAATRKGTVPRHP